MFKLEEICEELSQVQIPMRADELESIGVHVEEEVSADEAERFQDGDSGEFPPLPGGKKKEQLPCSAGQAAATAVILEVDPVEAYLIWQFTDSWLPYVEEEYPERHEGDPSPLRLWKGYQRVLSAQGMPLSTTCPTGRPSQRQERCLPVR